jgi:asparagine synthase (glutamine-hydrolysing)
MLAAARLVPGRFDGVTGVVRAPDPVARQLAAFAGVSGGGVRLRGLDGRDGTFAAAAVAERLGNVSGDPLATMLFLDGQLGLVDDMLHYFDRTSMAYSLEVRVPFLDHLVVEHCARIPSALKVKGMTTKFLLKQAARGIVPDRIIDKPKVGFFNAAVDEWFRAQTDGAIADYLLDERPAYAELIDRDQVARLVAEHASGRVNGRALLPVLMLEVWLREFLPRALATPLSNRERIEIAS